MVISRGLKDRHNRHFARDQFCFNKTFNWRIVVDDRKIPKSASHDRLERNDTTADNKNDECSSLAKKSKTKFNSRLQYPAEGDQRR
jgi:hypothetical protein